MDAALRLLLPTARELLARSEDPQAVALARAVVALAESAGPPAGRSGRERLTAVTAGGSVPACPACGRLFGAAMSRAVVPEHGPVGDRCPGGLARVVWT